MRVVTTWTAMVVLTAGSLAGQERAADYTRLEQGLRAAVNEYVLLSTESAKLEGRLTSVLRDSAFLGSNVVALRDIESVHVRSFQRDPLWNGAFMGAAIMAATGWAIGGAMGESDSGGRNIREVGAGVLLGAAIGLMVDAARDRKQWTEVWQHKE